MPNTPFLFFQTLSAVRFDSHVTLTARKSCLSGNKHYAVGNVAALKHRHLQATAFATALLLLVSLFCVASTIHVSFSYNQNNTFLSLTTKNVYDNSSSPNKKSHRRNKINKSI